MPGNEGSVDGSGHWRLSRREYAMAAGAALTTLSGCSSLDGSGSGGTGSLRRSVSEDFESGDYTRTLTDFSQFEAIDPVVSDAHARSGEHALVLESTPGLQTIARLRTTRPVKTPLEASVSLKKVTVPGGQNSVSLSMTHADESRRLRVYDSGYQGSVSARPEPLHGDPPDPLSITPTLPTGEWHELSIRVESGGTVLCGANGSTVSIQPVANWNDAVVFPTIKTSAWPNGHSIEVAFDDFSVSPL